MEDDVEPLRLQSFHRAQPASLVACSEHDVDALVCELPADFVADAFIAASDDCDAGVGFGEIHLSSRSYVGRIHAHLEGGRRVLMCGLRIAIRSRSKGQSKAGGDLY